MLCLQRLTEAASLPQGGGCSPTKYVVNACGALSLLQLILLQQLMTPALLAAADAAPFCVGVVVGVAR
jgi:hypothetical protein